MNSFVFAMEQEGGEVHEFRDLDIAIELHDRNIVCLFWWV